MAFWMLLALMSCTGSPDPEPTEAPDPVPEPATEAEPDFVAPVPTEPKYAATHVLVAWRGAARAPEGVERTEAEAQALARSLREQAAGGTALEDLAREHSDDPSAPRGGSLGVYLTGTMVPAFEAAVASVEPGEIAPLVRTPFGWHVVRRDPVVEARLAHVVVGWEGAWRASATRSKQQARARIEEARAALQAGRPFGEVAREYSEGPAASQGGDLGPVAPGQMIPAFEEAAFALDPGETSGVVETPYGFHLIRRAE